MRKTIDAKKFVKEFSNGKRNGDLIEKESSYFPNLDNSCCRCIHGLGATITDSNPTQDQKQLRIIIKNKKTSRIVRR
jgi:hypothetical protein